MEERKKAKLDKKFDEYIQRIELTLEDNTKRLEDNWSRKLEEKAIESTKQIEEEILIVREDVNEN